MAAPMSCRLLRQLNFEKKIGYFFNIRVVQPACCKSSFSTDASAKAVLPEKSSNKNISKAMRLYLKRTQEYDEFMKKEKINFKIGKRHLANMMGEDPETFTQEDIDRSIEYLFPSGLFEPRARPIMRPPEEVFPPKKAAEFDESGRPHHFLFYTSKPNYYQLLHDVVSHMNELNKYEDDVIRKIKQHGNDEELNLTGSEWISKESLEDVLVETLSDREYDNFVKLMERLVKHPYAIRVKDVVSKYRKLLMSQTKTYDIPKPEPCADGKSRITVIGGIRKTAVAEATITYPGSGKISINGSDILYFENLQSREQVVFPLIFTGLVDQVDVDATVRSGGTTSQAGAIRWAIAWGLRSFVSTDTVEKMRLAGLLTRDLRRRERKKPGQEGARRKYTWKKR